ncbi:hypothetical protein MY11210_008124 [Beauveria gryllotalpidicola]
MPAVPTSSVETVSQTSIVSNALVTMVIGAALRHSTVSFNSPVFPLVRYLVELLYDSVQCYYPMFQNPGFDFPLRRRCGDEDNPSHDSKTIKTRQPPCVHAPRVSVPSGGILEASRRGRGSGRGVRRTNAGVGRGRDSGRGDQSTSGRTDKNTNDDNEDNDGKGSNDGGGDFEEDSAMPRLLACPFYKFDPARHFRCYRKYELRRYSDVKGHIFRCHTLTYDGANYCPNCWRTWKKNEELLWVNHMSQIPRPCHHVPEPECLHPQEVIALDELDVTGLSEYKKWYRMWDLLFISHQAPPSPYVEHGLGEILLLVGHSHDTLLRELPVLLLELGIQVDYQVVQYLGNRIDGIYRQSLISGQPQSPRYRRQHAIQQQQEMQLQMRQSQAPGLEASDISAIVPAHLNLHSMDGIMDEFIHQDAGWDDAMHILGDGNNFTPGSPPPQAPSSSKKLPLENPAAPQMSLPGLASRSHVGRVSSSMNRYPSRRRSAARFDYRNPRAPHHIYLHLQHISTTAIKRYQRKGSQMDKSYDTLVAYSKYPALTREDLFLLFLNRKYGLGQDMVYCIQMVPDQMKKVKRSLGIGAAPETTTSQTSVVVGIDWPLRRFLQSQFVDEASRKQPFSSLITLTGFATDAQALTVGEYLSQTWPGIADKILQLLPTLLDPCLGQTPLRQGELAILCKDELELLYENLAFTWISCTARAGPAVKGVWECIPIFARAQAVETQLGTPVFVVHFLARPIPSTTQPGRCWQHMFQGAVLASGFPIPQRATKGLGLEMPLNMMAELSGSRRVVEWNDKIFIKGYSTMLVAIRSLSNILIWHYYYARPGKRVSYGDCMQQLGSPDANYKICSSRLPRSSAGFFLDQVVISAGSMITGGAILTPGVKELPPHLTRNGTIPQLKWLSKRYIVFWDEEVKRGWLVNGTSALLHIMRASLAQSEHDDSSACLMFDKSKMNNFPDMPYMHNTAMRVLIDQGNQGLVVYPDSISQTRKTSADSGNSTNTQTSTYFLFGDLAKKHFGTLEQMIDYHSHLAGRDGINLKIRLRKHLEGWDFVDLVNEIRPQPHVATIPTLGHGWIDFVRSIEAITLFGRNFGELLQPASCTGLCERWSSLPQQDYLLAASVADLTAIMEQYGDPHAAPRELARNILWHSPADTYAACPCKLSQASRHGKAAAYHVGPVQVLLPSGRVPPASGQRELEPDGAVVFGHNAIFGYRWPEKGTDEVPAKDFLVPLRNMLPVRLSKTQAELPDTLDSSERDVTSRLDSESSTSTPRVESPPSLRSSLRGLIPKRRSCTLQEGEETVKKKLKTKQYEEAAA